MRKLLILSIIVLLVSSNIDSFSQNSMTGDGFGGRGWYVPHNYQVGSYSAYTVCGDSSQLYGWGNNSQGELGNGSSTFSTAVPVAAIGMTHVKFYTTGYISAAIKNDNTAWVWGGAAYGGPAFGFTATPHQLLSNVKFLDAGSTHVVFVKQDSTVWGAGFNIYGQLGNGTQSDTILIPVQMTGITGAVRAIAVRLATAILLKDGTVKLCGGGGIFQPTNSITPVTLAGLSNIIDLKGNAYGVFALDNAGNVFAFGTDSVHLGLGNSYTPEVIPPTKINFPAGAAPIVALSANDDGGIGMALDSNHNVYGWGEAGSGQLGISGGDANTPVLIATDAIDIFAGETFSYILKSDGTLWASGSSLNNGTGASIWMNLSNTQRYSFTKIDPTIAPMNLCAPKPYGVVPIRLLNFNCTAVGNNTNLSWVAAEEINADQYIVEYSRDGIHFQSISVIMAKGSSSNYQYVHQQVSDKAFYRLKMIDRDGSFSFSDIWVLKFEKKAGITIAPNPANETLALFHKNNTVVRSVQVLSMDGQAVMNVSNYHNGQVINISQLANGCYLLKVVYKDNEMELARFVKI